MAHYVPSDLFSVDTNPKTVKGQKYGFMTGVMYLAPYTLSGSNTCPMAEIAGCVNACLNTAGKGAFSSVQNARINKTLYFLENQADFMRHVARDISKLIRAAKGAKLTPLVRLNGTSDIRWENIPVHIDESTHRAILRATGKRVQTGDYPNIMAVFPRVQFYDYTKIPNRKNIPSNYDLTFSYSGVPAYFRYVETARAAGMRIAVVFRRREDIPAEFIGMRCVDGDDSDIRHLDPRGVVVALYAKGKARRDNSGFVVDAGARRIIPIAQA